MLPPALFWPAAADRMVKIRFVLRGLLLSLLLALLLIAGWIFIQTPFARPPDPTPPPPTILAPPGSMPAGPVGLREWALYRGRSYQPVGSGFLLRLSSGDILGITAAHAVSFEQPGQPLERIALGVAGRPYFAVESDTLRGRPGRRLTPEDLSIDYLFLKVESPVDTSLVLVPDPRGMPQPGERVSLYSGLGDGSGGQRVLEGTVQSVDNRAIWVLMDDRFNPSQLSGSPLVSQHTGQAVGMVLAVSPRGTHLLLGAHPIGSLVRLAESATEFPKLIDLIQTQP
jgi:Trypsin-like peptidase domain